MKIVRINWRNPGHYPDPDKLEPVWWAWEFLRRNPLYVEEWEKAYFPWRESCTDPTLAGKNTFMLPPSDGDLEAFVDRWHVAYLFNPLNNRPLPFPAASSRKALRHWWGGVAGKVHASLAPHELAVAFDMSRPLKPQLERANDLLKHFTEFAEITSPINRPKSQRERWPLFLRILDAKTAGASNKDIYRHLHDGQQVYEAGSREADNWVQNQKHAAETMRDHGYKKLLAAL